jgi:hypothetical protein
VVKPYYEDARPLTAEEEAKFRESVRMLGDDGYSLHWSNNAAARLLATLDEARTPGHVYLPWVVDGVPECSIPWCKQPPERHPRSGDTTPLPARSRDAILALGDLLRDEHGESCDCDTCLAVQPVVEVALSDTERGP